MQARLQRSALRCATCPAHDAPRAAELDGAIAADEAELTLAQAALKFRMRPRLQQRPSRSRLRALRCPLHRDAASDSSNFGLDTGHVVVLWHVCVSLTCVSVNRREHSCRCACLPLVLGCAASRFFIQVTSGSCPSPWASGPLNFQEFVAASPPGVFGVLG